MKKVLVTGGAGYVGSFLVPRLLKSGFHVQVFDTCWYWPHPFASLKNNSRLKVTRGDIRDRVRLKNALRGMDSVIHLACVSNDPSFELDPGLGKEINLDAFPILLEEMASAKIKRFIYASSSSVYGLQSAPKVTEDAKCKPLTDYSKFKLECEVMLKDFGLDACWTILRPATVCGYSQRLRLDLVVNILTIQALKDRHITVFGGSQLRPNINICDMARAYIAVLKSEETSVHGKTYNVGYENKTVLDIAKLVKEVVSEKVTIECKSSDDLRSYHIDSSRILRELGFVPDFDIAHAIKSIKIADEYGLIRDHKSNPLYYNITRMKEIMSEGTLQLSKGKVFA